ncbi:hypothetical protein F4861DRAFT_540335 [Xylaria intraflava]|nr:hypothetical protein F4861DRAFT_540335 [Xylaria intraflava]
MICITPSSLKTSLPLLFSVSLAYLSLASAAAVHFPTALAPRQNQTSTPPIPTVLPVSCDEYSRIANLSIIAQNSTLRAAFIRSSPLGTLPAAAILDIESPKLMYLTLNVKLNQVCNNLSALALVEAGHNLTAGTVAGMRILDAPGVAPDSITMPILAVLFILLMGVPATAL